MVVGGAPVLSTITDTTFAVGEDDAIDHNGAEVRVERVWIESFFHEGIAASKGHRIRILDTVVKGCDQGIESGYGSPEVVVERCLVTGNRLGLRWGDSYDWGSEGTLTVTSSIVAGNVDGAYLGQDAKFGEPPPGAVDIGCSVLDDPVFDGLSGNVAGTPAWTADGCLDEGSLGADVACDGGPVGPRSCP
jgi:hypothetical protein